MKLRLKSAVSGLAALALASGIVAAGGGIALAATPPYEPDPGSTGAVSLYDTSGNQVVSGDINTPFGYALSSTAGRVGDTKATLFAYTPKLGVASGAWSGEALTGSTNYPNAAAPAPLGTSTLPLVSGTATDETLGFYIANSFPNTATDAYANLYQLRVKTSGPTGANTAYSSVSVLVTGTTWTQVYPAPPAAVATTTTLSVSPASPQLVGTNVTLSATVAPASGTLTNGSVKFFDGGTQVGATQAFTGAAVSVSTTTLTTGTHSLTAQYVPAGIAFTGSTSAAKTYVISGPAVATTTALSVNPISGPAFAPVTLAATVTGAGAAGTVNFFDNGAAVPVASAPVSAGAASSIVSSLGVGAHSIVATFVPTDAAAFIGSSSAAVTATYTAPATIPDPQTITVTVAAGTLTITTPYGPSNPFDLGTMVLAADGTQLSVAKAFPNAGDHLTITDTRAGDLPWTASASTTDFASGANLINGQNFGFTSVAPSYISGNALNAGTKPVVVNDVPAIAGLPVAPAAAGSAGLKGGPHSFATAAQGVGSVYINGALSLKAPTSAQAGTYTATLTFTVG